MDQLTLCVKEAKNCRERAKKASNPAEAEYWLQVASFVEGVVEKLKAEANAPNRRRSTPREF